LAPFDTGASTALFDWLLRRPLSAVPPGTRVVVIPDGAVGTVPLEVLTWRGTDGTLEFAGDRYVLAYAPSATVLMQQRAPGRERGGAEQKRPLLAVGDPVYDPTDPRAEVATAAQRNDGSDRSPRETAWHEYARTRGLEIFARLPATGREVRDIATAL